MGGVTGHRNTAVVSGVEAAPLASSLENEMNFGEIQLMGMKDRKIRWVCKRDF